MNPRFYLNIKGGKWWYCDKSLVEAYMSGQPDGRYYFDLSKDKGAPKTSPQQGYYYGVVIPHTLKALKEQGNEDIVLSIGQAGRGYGQGFKHLPLIKENVDDMLKQLWETKNDCEIKSKAGFSLDEYSELIDVSIQWVAKYLSYVIPPPDKDWRKEVMP